MRILTALLLGLAGAALLATPGDDAAIAAPPAPAAADGAPIHHAEQVIGDTRVVLVSVLQGVVFSPGALPNADGQPRAVPYVRVEYLVEQLGEAPLEQLHVGGLQLLDDHGDRIRPLEVARGVSTTTSYDAQVFESLGIAPDVVVADRSRRRVEYEGALRLPSGPVSLVIRTGFGRMHEFRFDALPLSPGR